MERDSFRRTFETFETADAVLLAIGLGSLFRDRPYRTSLHTILAMGAVFCDKSF